MGVFTYSNASVGSVGLFMYISFNLLAIVVIFTENVFTIAFISVTSFISQETEGMYLIIREIIKLWFFSPYFSPILWAKHNLLKYLNKRLRIYAYKFQTTWRNKGIYRFVELQTHYSELLLHTYICICIYMYSATATATDQCLSAATGLSSWQP